MIRSRKEMNEYIRQDMKRNLVSGGGQNPRFKYC